MTAAGQLEVRITPGQDGATCLHLSGVIDERFESQSLLSKLSPITILDLEGIKRITSFGVRQWSEAMKSLPSTVRHLYLVRCPPCFVDQLNMVLNFGGPAEIVTATAIYFCEKCQDERQVPIDIFADRMPITSGQVTQASCTECNEPLTLEDDPQQYFRFATNYGAKSIEPAASKLLGETGLYHAKAVGGPPEEVKLVHGEVTLFKISGTLDTRFKPRRLASGVEGHVVFDLGGVEGIDTVGAQSWRKLLEALTGATSIVLVEVPEAVLSHVAGGRMSIDRTILHSVKVRYRCAACRNEMSEPLKPSEFGQSQARPCRRCGKPSSLVTGANVLEIVFGIARRTPGTVPPASEEVINTREELLSRARAESGGGRSGGDASGLARYRVIRPLSQGGMAEILLAVHQGIGGFEKLIALKKIRREMLERRHVAIELFLNEAKIAANLNHPNIVQIFEVGEHGGDLFIAMEYVHGADAREVLRQVRSKNRKLTVEQIIYIGTQVAAALDHAHTARDLAGRPLKIVHRDVSPSNVVIGFEGQVKLVDFGVATASVVGASPEGLIGKCSYMSPEQVGSHPLDGRSDVFSLGIVLYELIAGRPLFRRQTDEATLMAVLRDPVPSLAEHGVPDFLEKAIGRALARGRDERYPDARAFQLALEDCQQRIGSPVTSHQVSLFMKELFPDRSATTPTADKESPQTLPTAAEPRATATVTPEPSDSASKSYEISVVPWEESADATTVDPAAGVATASKPKIAASSEVARVAQKLVTSRPTPPPSSPSPPEPAQAATKLIPSPPAGVAPSQDPAPRQFLWTAAIIVLVVGVLIAAGLIYTGLT